MYHRLVAVSRVEAFKSMHFFYFFFSSRLVARGNYPLYTLSIGTVVTGET